MRKLLKWLFFGFLGLSVLGAVIESSKSPEQKAAEAAARESEDRKKAEDARKMAIAQQAAVQSYTAHDLARAYEQNTVAADAMFKGKRFKVSGTVISINTDLFSNPYLVLKGGVNQFMEPQFSFDKKNSSQLGALRKGAQVQLICTGKGDIAKTPMAGDCIML